MSSTTPVRKPLGVRVTPEQHKVLAEAAKREHRSMSSFVLQAAMREAEGRTPPKPRYTEEETNAIVRQAQEAMRPYRVKGRSLVDELIAERRAEAARE